MDALFWDRRRPRLHSVATQTALGQRGQTRTPAVPEECVHSNQGVTKGQLFPKSSTPVYSHNSSATDPDNVSCIRDIEPAAFGTACPTN